MSRIRLKFPAKCRECGTDLEVGDTVRYYGRGRIYGTACHIQTTWIDRYYNNSEDPNIPISIRDLQRMVVN